VNALRNEKTVPEYSSLKFDVIVHDRKIILQCISKLRPVLISAAFRVAAAFRKKGFVVVFPALRSVLPLKQITILWIGFKDIASSSTRGETTVRKQPVS
jgi:hypothetical protein